MALSSENLPVMAKVVGGGTVSAWTATIEPFMGVTVGFLTILVLLQSLYKNWKSTDNKKAD
tara:strand:+ start:210 stop:392 length:183 start_codon:yes stop_codon:yes gene_type:complete